MSLYVQSFYCLMAIVFFAVMASTTGVSSSGGTVRCDRVASPAGSNINPGSESFPYRTTQHLADSLSAGQTGCLRSGTYRENVKISVGGSAESPVTLRSYPGERAKVVGRLWITKSADHVTVSHLNLNGKNSRGLPSPTVNADHVTFYGNDITNNRTAICLLLGSDWGDADNAVVARNRIHNCGRLPATNFDHGIYVAQSRGSVIRDNFIYDNADRGIQLYPAAKNTKIYNNVIDGNGQGIIFSGDDGVASTGNVVEYNIITNSRIRYNVESWYPKGNPIGVRNRVRRNCIYGGKRGATDGGIESSRIGFAASRNNYSDPKYRSRAKKDFRLRGHSSCRKLLTKRRIARKLIK